MDNFWSWAKQNSGENGLWLVFALAMVAILTVGGIAECNVSRSSTNSHISEPAR